MANLGVLKYGSDVLRTVAQPVEEITDEIRQIVNDMLDTMYASEGVGLAAPQVGVSKRIVVIDANPTDASSAPIIMINPEIVRHEGHIDAEEGCLSVPELRGEVRRSEKVVVEAIDLDGKKVTIEATDPLARIIQHEIDHLNGMLFIDHLSRLKRQLMKKQLRKIEESSKDLN